MHVVVVVLGDLGRSPRMQYHCQSLLDAGHRVSFVGYEGEDLIESLAAVQAHNSDRFQLIRFRVPTLFEKVKPLYFVWRILSLSLYLGAALFFSVSFQPVDFVLVQNPPALPLLAVAYAYCRIQALTQGRRPGFIIDWHNLGYSMLRDGSAFQRVARLCERFFAPYADGHLTVTKALKDFLSREMNVTKNIDVLYDCPPELFQPLRVEEQHKILSKLDEQFRQACPRSWWAANDTTKQTLFTEECEPYMFRHRPGRPALVTSSTSWTPDEDFDVLLTALEKLDEMIHADASSLKLLVVVTGKGPQRSMYEEKISRMQLRHVAVATVWLEAGDYPKLLACADLGVSLHTSTSGLDLPMKVLDLFGCEVPVVAHEFLCLDELVQDGVNGHVFGTSQQLSDLLYELLRPLASTTNTGSAVPNHSYGALQTYSKQLQGRERWNTNWLDHALPVILRSAHMG